MTVRQLTRYQAILENQWSSCLDHGCRPNRFHQGQMWAQTMITATDFEEESFEKQELSGPDFLDLGRQRFCLETPKVMTSLSKTFLQKAWRLSSSCIATSRGFCSGVVVDAWVYQKQSEGKCQCRYNVGIMLKSRLFETKRSRLSDTKMVEKFVSSQALSNSQGRKRTREYFMLQVI